MSIPLTEAIERAQVAFDSGDYRSVVDSCSRIVDQYPHYMEAHRLLGQAYLEQGQSQQAEASFAQVLSHDPREASAYLGLGLIAEERGVLEHALAYCQVAWELAPNQPHFREPVIRVAEKRFGGEGHLRLTHAALAQIHANAWRLRRAAREYQTALTALPDRVDLWIGLGETLWHLGDDADAAEISREFLKEHPDLLQALVILADIEYRNGNRSEAERYLERVRGVDPDGRQIRAMVEANPRASATFLVVADEQVPILVERGDVVVSERPMIAPAPDFTYQPDEDQEVSEVDIDELQPIALEEFEDEPGEAAVTGRTAGADELVEEPVVEAAAEDVEFEDLEAELQEIEQAEDIVLDDAPEEAEAVDEPLTLAEEEDDLVAAMDSAEDGLEDLLDEFEGIQPMSFEEFGAVEGMVADERSGFFEDADIDFDMRIEDPDAVQIGGPPPAAAGAFVATGEGLGSLSGEDAGEFPEFPDVEEPEQETVADAQTEILDDIDEVAAESGPEIEEVPAAEQEPEFLDEAPTEETPAPVVSVPSGTGYTTLIGELGSEGMAPFDPSRVATNEAEDQPVMETPSIDEPDEASVVEDWDEIDDDLAAAIPTEIASTDELLELEGRDLEPFTSEDEDTADGIDQVLDAERDELGDIGTVAEQSEVEPDQIGVSEEQEPADQVEVASTGFTDILGGIEPFAIEEFDELVDDDEPFSFGNLPWEQDTGDSALPSDEDLEAMLGVDGTPAETQPEKDAAGPPDEDEVEHAEPAQEAAPPPEFGDPVDDFDFSTAVTRELGESVADPDFERRMAEIEAAANRNIESARLEPADRAEPAESGYQAPAGEPDAGPDDAPLLKPGTNPLRPGSGFMRRLEPDSLVANEGLFQRSRAAKDEMVAEGIIRGDRELYGDGDEPVEQPEARVQPAGTSVTRDVETLRAALQADPNDDEIHWWLAEALRARGEIHEALTEYRWLIRQAPGRRGRVIEALNGCIDAGQEPELAHRLLADAYRRHGDSSQARHHASLAMAVRRQTRQLHV